jgi:hypothetical protein
MGNKEFTQQLIRVLEVVFVNTRTFENKLHMNKEKYVISRQILSVQSCA